MTLQSLQALTWVTVSGAVASALLLASFEPGGLPLPLRARGDASRPPGMPAVRHAAKTTAPAHPSPTVQAAPVQATPGQGSAR